MTMMTLIVIPALNEEKTISHVVNKVRLNGWDHVLVVDDGSDDTTFETAAAMGGVHVIRLPINLGAWGAIQTGMQYAVDKGFDRVVTMDADNQHEAEAIDLLVRRLEDNGNDLVIGSCLSRGSLAKRFIWKMFRILSGLEVADVTSGFRAYSQTAVKLMLTRKSHVLDYQDVGVLMLCRKYKLKIEEIHVDMNHRAHGRSRVYKNFRVIVQYVLTTLFLIGVKRW